MKKDQYNEKKKEEFVSRLRNKNITLTKEGGISRDPYEIYFSSLAKNQLNEIKKIRHR